MASAQWPFIHLPLYNFYHTLLPVIMVYCNILPNLLPIKNLLPQLLKMVPAGSFQLSLLSGTASVAVMSSKDTLLPAVAHIQELHIKSAMAVIALHRCSTLFAAHCCFTAVPPTRVRLLKPSLNKYPTTKLYLSAWFLRNTPYNICF